MCWPQPGAGEQGTRDAVGYLQFGGSWGLYPHGSLLRKKMLVVFFPRTCGLFPGVCALLDDGEVRRWKSHQGFILTEHPSKSSPSPD